MNKTGIEWADMTLNPFIGCSPVSEGCKNCYASRIAHRLGSGLYRGPGVKKYQKVLRDIHPVWNGQIEYFEERLGDFKKAPAGIRVFIGSMGDLFHDNVTDDFIEKVFNEIYLNPHLICILLTKRAHRMRDRLNRYQKDHAVLRNLWAGVTVENMSRIDRINVLLETKAEVRFVSFEPLLEYISDRRIIHELDWIIAGPETGRGRRPYREQWFEQMRNIAIGAGVPFFFKGYPDKRGEEKYQLNFSGEIWEELPAHYEKYRKQLGISD